MKVLFTHEIFLPEASGGGEFLIARVASMLMKRGHEVKVLTSGDPAIKQYKNIPTIRIRTNRYLMNFQLKRIIEESKDVDIIHTSSGNTCFPSWVAAKLNKKPICCYVHHIFGPYWKDIRWNIVGSIFQLMEKIFLTRNYDAVIFQNKSSLKLGLGMAIDKKKTHLIHPGIDYGKFQIRAKKEPFVLFVGNLDMSKPTCKTKGLGYLLEAARQLPETKFVVVGKGHYLNELKKTSPPNVTFTGPLFGKELIKMYNRAMIFCLPSLNEGFGLTVLEAMASGCAIISTIDIGQEGILIKPKSSEQIKNAIQSLISNPAKTLRIGQKNRKLAKKFTWQKFTNNLIKIYNSITTK
jgi:glycosyltransferase involved in cell wall biosynthesis